MNTKLLLGALGCIVPVAVGAAVLFMSKNEALAPSPVEIADGADENALQGDAPRQLVHTSPALGLQFAYTVGEGGYVVNEIAPEDSGDRLVRTVILTPYGVAETVPEGSDGPAVLSVSVYKNDENAQPRAWAESYPTQSNYTLKQGEVEERIVGGVNAVAYLTDGLYAADTVVVAHGDFVYVFTGMFMDQASIMREDFKTLLGSVTFIPSDFEVPRVEMGAPTAKVDVRFVCENALAFTTFPDGVSAEAFVQDCIDGKHPEVIESYLEQLGLDGAAI